MGILCLRISRVTNTRRSEIDPRWGKIDICI